MGRTPWQRLPEGTSWNDLRRDCQGLGISPKEVRRIVKACQSRGFTPKEGIGIVRSLRQRHIILWIAEDIRDRFAGRTARDIIKAARRQRERCPAELRQKVILLFDRTCQYCGGKGSKDAGPDGRPWHVDRLLARDRRYHPTNITLACARCNQKKGPKRARQGVRNLADVRPLSMTARGGINPRS